MIVTPFQLVMLRLVRRIELPNFFVCYAKVIITLTFSLIWMRLLIFWKRFNFQLVIIIISLSEPSLVDGLVNIFPSLIILVDQVVNMISSSVEPLTQVVDPVPSSINATLHLKIETQVIDPILSLIDPTPPLKSATHMVDPTPHS
jgi:hypothetical protein